MSERDPETPEARATVLVIGGWDPTGGAGLVQDVTVVRARGLHPLSVLTTMTVQNTSQVSQRQALSPSLIRAQLDSLTREFQIGSVKLGVLGSAAIVQMIAAWLLERPRLPVILDPVGHASSGGELSEPGTAESLARDLFPKTRVLTPNLQEAAAFSGRPVTGRDHIPEAAQALRDQGAEWVLIKGGHLSGGQASDYLGGPGTSLWLEEERRPRRTPRGTGCALASALACGLSRGETVPEAVRGAKQFVTAAMDRSYDLGRGRFLDFPSS